jgi:hypothetical protein
MASPLVPTQWQFYRFGLIVTGKGERVFLPWLFRSLTAWGNCTFEVIRQIGQRSPISSPKRKLQMVGSGKTIPDRDETEIGLPARQYLAQKGAFVLLVDDLEGDRAVHVLEVFQRYRNAFDTMLGPYKHRTSIHFLVNMLEAYFFADAKAINAVLGTNLTDFPDDVETIRHPKNDLKKLKAGYDEIEHGRQIIARLDVPQSYLAWTPVGRSGRCSAGVPRPLASRHRAFISLLMAFTIPLRNRRSITCRIGRPSRYSPLKVYSSFLPWTNLSGKKVPYR